MNGDQDCNLDQWLTSALAAMLVAAEHWERFTAELEALGVPCEISEHTMRHHAEHLSQLIDPSRMPR